jgi:hypothetical protein
MSNFVKYALIRAIKTVCQTAVATIGTAFVISDVNWGIVVSASLLTGLLSLLTSVATGLPEAEYAEHIYMSHEEPEDSEVTNDEDE